jgi:hypothetical protein
VVVGTANPAVVIAAIVVYTGKLNNNTMAHGWHGP